MIHFCSNFVRVRPIFDLPGLAYLKADQIKEVLNEYQSVCFTVTAQFIFRPMGEMPCVMNGDAYL